MDRYSDDSNLSGSEEKRQTKNAARKLHKGTGANNTRSAQFHISIALPTYVDGWLVGWLAGLKCTTQTRRKEASKKYIHKKTKEEKKRLDKSKQSKARAVD